MAIAITRTELSADGLRAAARAARGDQGPLRRRDQRAPRGTALEGAQVHPPVGAPAPPEARRSSATGF